jgi:ABC-type lipoprotein export system ATPase subunit
MSIHELRTPLVETSDAVVSARDVRRRYGDGDTAVDALRGVSVDIARGKLTAVMGPSGSGKSTLMHILAGLDRPTAGEVTLAGVDVVGLDDAELTSLRRDHIGFIFQFFNLLPMLTAAENIVLPLNLDSTTSGEILGLLRESVDTFGQTTVMVTHDAHAAAIADRVLYLADGEIVRDIGQSSAHEILDVLEQVSAR